MKSHVARLYYAALMEFTWNELNLHSFGLPASYQAMILN